MAAVSMAGIASLFANIVPEMVVPVSVKLPDPPRLEGPLAANDYLMLTKAYAHNRILGPESFVIVPDSTNNNYYIYTGLKDGWVVEILPDGNVRKILRMSIQSCGYPGAREDACGRPMGLRRDGQTLIVADAYNGIFRIFPRTGKYQQLVDARNLIVEGEALGYINDLDISKDGSIFFTSSSNKWKPSQFLNILLEAEISGRVLMYNPHEANPSKKVQEVVTGLNYPNGVQLSPEEDFLLVAEGGRSRIMRAWIGRNKPKFGTLEVFADNLPGNVDNIRPSTRGTYWVALSRARHADLPSVLDTYGEQPEVRKNLINLVMQNMIFDDPKFAIVVEMDKYGNIVRSLQDATGAIYTTISEVQEVNNILFIASKDKNFVGIIDLKKIPMPSPLDPYLGPAPYMVDLSKVKEPSLRDLLTRVQQRLEDVSGPKLTTLAVLLAEQLYETKADIDRSRKLIADMRVEVQRLRQILQQHSASRPTTPAPTSAPTTTTEDPSLTLPPPDQGAVVRPGGSVDAGAVVGPVVTTPPRPVATTPIAGTTTPASAPAATTPSAAAATTPTAAAGAGTTTQPPAAAASTTPVAGAPFTGSGPYP